MNHDERDERDELWALLGRARSPEVAADFARRTAGAVHGLRPGDDPAAGSGGGERRVLAFPALVRRAAISTAAAAAACVVLLLMWQQPDGAESDHVAAVSDRAPAMEPGTGIPLDVEPWEWELDELAWLDHVVAVNDPSTLSDEALAYLLY